MRFLLRFSQLVDSSTNILETILISQCRIYLPTATYYNDCVYTKDLDDGYTWFHFRRRWLSCRYLCKMPPDHLRDLSTEFSSLDIPLLRSSIQEKSAHLVFVSEKMESVQSTLHVLHEYFLVCSSFVTLDLFSESFTPSCFSNSNTNNLNPIALWNRSSLTAPLIAVKTAYALP